MDLLVMVGGWAFIALCWLLFEHLPELRARSRDRFRRQQQLAEDKENARLLDGLPPHARCLCARCRAWRQVPGNTEQLRLRGLR